MFGSMNNKSSHQTVSLDSSNLGKTYEHKMCPFCHNTEDECAFCIQCNNNGYRRCGMDPDHRECEKCGTCLEDLDNDEYIIEDDSTVYCKECETKDESRCISCKEVIDPEDINFELSGRCEDCRLEYERIIDGSHNNSYCDHHAAYWINGAYGCSNCGM